MTLDPSEIRKTLAVLERRDPDLQWFGASGHQYQLNPPLAPAVLEAFERQHGIALPEDYKRFLTTIGNGGAGPSYRLFPLGQDDDGPWSDMTVGDLGQPFPHSSAWNLPESFWDQEPDPPPGTPPEEEDRLYEAWDALLAEHYWHPRWMDGAIPICHRGCGLFQWLVVHGPQRGTVWNDDRADHAGVCPLLDANGQPMTFTRWYLDWLEKAQAGEIPSLAQRRQVWVTQHVLPERLFFYVFALGTILGVLWASGIRGLGRARILVALASGLLALALIAGLDRLLLARRRRRQ